MDKNDDDGNNKSNDSNEDSNNSSNDKSNNRRNDTRKNNFTIIKIISYSFLLCHKTSPLGILYKALGQSSKGIEKQELLERAEEALQDAFELRKEMLGMYVHGKNLLQDDDFSFYSSC